MTHHLFLWIKFYWNIATTFVYVLAKTAFELQWHSWVFVTHVAHRAGIIYYLALYTKSLPTHVLKDSPFNITYTPNNQNPIINRAKENRKSWAFSTPGSFKIKEQCWEESYTTNIQCPGWPRAEQKKKFQYRVQVVGWLTPDPL